MDPSRFALKCLPCWDWEWDISWAGFNIPCKSKGVWLSRISSHSSLKFCPSKAETHWPSLHTAMAGLLYFRPWESSRAAWWGAAPQGIQLLAEGEFVAEVKVSNSTFKSASKSWFSVFEPPWTMNIWHSYCLADTVWQNLAWISSSCILPWTTGYSPQQEVLSSDSVASINLRVLGWFVAFMVFTLWDRL